MKYIVTRSYALALATSITGMVVIGIIRPLIVFDVLEHESLYYVSLLTASFMATRGLTSLVAGEALWRRRAGEVASTAILLWIAALILYMVLDTPLYPFIRIIEGAAAGLLWPAMQVVAVEGAGERLRNTALSIYFVSGSLAYNAGIYLGALISPALGRVSLYYLSIIILAALALALYLLLPGLPSRRNTVPRRRGYRIVLRSMGPVIPLAIIAGGIGGLMLDYMMAYARQELGLGRGSTRIYWSYAGYLALVFSIIVSRLADKHGGARYTVAAAYVSIAPLALLAFPMPPLIYFTMLSLPMVGQKILKPLIRGYAVEVTGDTRSAVPAVNFLSNMSAAAVTVLVAYLVHILGPRGGAYVVPGFTAASLVTLTAALYAMHRRRATAPAAAHGSS